jgi:hypothetical protein
VWWVVSSVPAAAWLLSEPTMTLQFGGWGMGLTFLPRKNSLVTPATGSHDLKADQTSKSEEGKKHSDLTQ